MVAEDVSLLLQAQFVAASRALDRLGIELTYMGCESIDGPFIVHFNPSGRPLTRAVLRELPTPVAIHPAVWDATQVMFEPGVLDGL